MEERPITKTESTLVDALVYGAGVIGFLLFCYYVIPAVLK
jgi:hypothetical protein